MEQKLTSNQLRVIGCLIEKMITTPEHYPLSLNSLTNACNQKSNRDPVLSLSEESVQKTLDELTQMRMVRGDSGFGSRVVKYKHRFCNTEFGTLQFSDQELAILCVMFLRGPQTPGELRTRTNRLCDFNDVHEVDQVLTEMMAKEQDPLVVRLEREPGKSACRYAHLFGDGTELKVAAEANQNIVSSQSENDSQSPFDNERINTLEAKVDELQHEVSQLKQIIDDLMN